MGMRLRKLKAWFRRRRRGNEERAATRSPDPAPAESRAPAAGAGPAADHGRPPAALEGAKKPATGPARREDRGRPLSRQGIPILKPDEDLAAHFNDAPAEEVRPHSDAGKVAKTGKGKAGRPLRPSRQKPEPRNRVGIRRLDDDADLQAIFMPDGEAPPEKETTGAPDAPAPKPADRPRGADIPTNRHGIPRLDNHTDLQRLFDATHDDAADSEELGESLRQSLAHDARGLMKKKTGGFFPLRRMSLKEKLRRYPDPQAQMDLHGATATRARERAAAFIRTAQTDGLYTLRIIVGKGLHSESGAVLPDVIEDLLLELKREGTVLSYRWEKGVKRKSGALIVFLSPPFP